VPQHNIAASPTLSGGAEGSRTPDLLIANEVFYQLNYGPSSIFPTLNDLQENRKQYSLRKYGTLG
jgi:hypothetical protein